MRNQKLMKLKTLKAAALIIALSAAPALAGDYGNVSVKNCTWCHGTPSAQGYAPAPRLAGQRQWYIENQINSFRAHRRNNTFSKMYMWPATANVTRGRRGNWPNTSRDCIRKRPTTATGRWSPPGGPSIGRACRT